MRKKIPLLLLLATAHFLICILSGAINWQFQMVAVATASILAVFFATKRIDQRIWASLLVIAPFYLLYSVSSIRFYSYPTYPIWIFGLLISLLTYLLIRIKAPAVFSMLFLSFLVIVGGLIIWPNSFAYINMEKDPERFDLSRSRIVDETGKEISYESFRGKVHLVDIWHSACLPCIKKFPVVQELHEEYSEDPQVRIVSLNLPMPRDSGIRPTRFTDRYSFEKYYFMNKEEFEKFSKEQFPIYLVIDKNLKCRYAGDLNIGWNIFVKNVRHIINDLKKE